MTRSPQRVPRGAGQCHVRGGREAAARAHRTSRPRAPPPTRHRTTEMCGRVGSPPVPIVPRACMHRGTGWRRLRRPAGPPALVPHTVRPRPHEIDRSRGHASGPHPPGGPHTHAQRPTSKRRASNESQQSQCTPRGRARIADDCHSVSVRVTVSHAHASREATRGAAIVLWARGRTHVTRGVG